ncbi:Sec24-like protein, partial [Giardia lamblia P15]
QESRCFAALQEQYKYLDERIRSLSEAFVTRSMGCNPLSTINPVEYSNPSVEKLYLSRSTLINRLAYIAASHNIGIDIVALPIDKNVNLGLVPLSSLCIMTGGTLLYNEASAYAEKHSAGATGLGNADFAANALLRLLTATQGISATLSIRTSEGLTVSMQEVTGKSASFSLSSALTATGASTLWTNTRDFIATTMSRRSGDGPSGDDSAFNKSAPSASGQAFGVSRGRPSVENIAQLIQIENKPRYKVSSADNFFANYFKVSDVEYSFASISEYTSYVMELKYNAKLPADCRNSYVQTALLYTSTDGSRRLRVSTLQLAVSDNFTDIYSNIDQSTYMSWLAKKLAFLTLNSAALVMGDIGALGGRILLEKPVSDSSVDVEIEAGLVKYGSIVIGSAVPSNDHLSMPLHGRSVVNDNLLNTSQASQNVQASVVQSISNSLGLQGKRKTIDEGVRTGHMSANGAAYLLSKYGGLLTVKQLPLNIASSSLLFDGEYSYGAILRGRKTLEQMVYPLIRQFRDLSTSIANDRLTVPTNMDLVPFYLMGLTRTALCHAHRSENEGGPFTADMRCSTAFLVVSASASCIASMLYPVMYNITTYLTSFVPEVENYKIAHPEAALTMPVSIPTPVRACSRYIENLTGSILYIVSGNTSFFWVGSLVPEELRRKLFGVRSHSELRVAPLSLYVSTSQDKGIFSTLLSFITIIKKLTDCCGGDIVVPEGVGGVEGLVRWMLVEDSTSQDKSYADFLNGFATAVGAA